MDKIERDHFDLSQFYPLMLLISSKPIRRANSTGTAFPICLYFSPIPPENSQESGKL